MFGLGWEQIIVILLVGLFLLGPERIPTTVQWVAGTLRKVKTMAAGAQAQLRTEIGPELDELRRQIAELQSLKEIQELRDLKDLHPRRIIGRNILGDEFSGGLTGVLGLNTPPVNPLTAPDPAPAPQAAPVTYDTAGPGEDAVEKPVSAGGPGEHSGSHPFEGSTGPDLSKPDLSKSEASEPDLVKADPAPEPDPVAAAPAARFDSDAT